MARHSGPLKIYVEGRNDQFALINLLIRHGIDYGSKPWPKSFPEFQPGVKDADDPSHESAGLEAVLSAISDEIKNQAGRAVAFVLDGDDDPGKRWADIQRRFADSDVTTADSAEKPVKDIDSIPPEGFVGFSQRYQTRVGLWMMPNNQSAGALEHFLEALLPKDGDGGVSPLFQFASDQTVLARTDKGAEFREIDTLKARLACWLAWQKSPGRPYGTAIRANYFRHDSPEARLFVQWFKNVFRIAD